jgi:hypothetical protein
MQVLTAIGRELLGLFVSDMRFTGALAAWIAVVAAIPVFLKPASSAEAVVLFVGFAVILIENLMHVAAGRRQR